MDEEIKKEGIEIEDHATNLYKVMTMEKLINQLLVTEEVIYTLDEFDFYNWYPCTCLGCHRLIPITWRFCKDCSKKYGLFDDDGKLKSRKDMAEWVKYLIQDEERRRYAHMKRHSCRIPRKNENEERFPE